MHQHQRRCIECQRAFDDFPWINRGTAECTVEQLFIRKHPVLVVQKQHGKYFMLSALQQGL